MGIKQIKSDKNGIRLIGMVFLSRELQAKTLTIMAICSIHLVFMLI